MHVIAVHMLPNASKSQWDRLNELEVYVKTSKMTEELREFQILGKRNWSSSVSIADSRVTIY